MGETVSQSQTSNSSAFNAPPSQLPDASEKSTAHSEMSRGGRMGIIAGNWEDRSAHAVSVLLDIDQQQQTERKPNICRTAGLRKISFYSEINERCAHRIA